MGTAITINGKLKLERELKNLLEKERPSVIQAIEVARELGDLKENAEYHAAKERQSFIEGRLAEINGKLATSEVVDTSKIKSDKIVFGATVTIINCDTDKKTKYQIVGEDEADVAKGSISIMSPLARGLIGKQKGDIATVKTPNGEVDYEIVDLIYV